MSNSTTEQATLPLLKMRNKYWLLKTYPFQNLGSGGVNCVTRSECTPVGVELQTAGQLNGRIVLKIPYASMAKAVVVSESTEDI